jgi:hypothetical protein
MRFAASAGKLAVEDDFVKLCRQKPADQFDLNYRVATLAIVLPNPEMIPTFARLSMFFNRLVAFLLSRLIVTISKHFLCAQRLFSED